MSIIEFLYRIDNGVNSSHSFIGNIYLHLVSVYKLANHPSFIIQMENGWAPVCPEVAQRVFQLMLRTFDSDTGSPDNPRARPPLSQTHYNYTLQNLERVFESFETEAFAPTFGRLFDTVLLRLAVYDATGKTKLAGTSRLVSCLLSEFMGRTLRKKDFHPILLRFLRFVARDERLLRNVMQFGGHMKYFCRASGPLDEMIVAGHFESLVYDSVFKYGSMDLFTFVVDCDMDTNAGAACLQYTSYADVLWSRRHRAPSDVQTLHKLDYVVSKCGGNFLQFPMQSPPAAMPGAVRTGVLQAFLRHEHVFLVPQYNQKSVDIIIYLALACTEALRPQSNDFGMHYTSILQMVAARGHTVDAGEQFERLCDVLLQYASLSDLIDKFDHDNMSIEDYAGIREYHTILDSIHHRRRKLTVCLALHHRLGSSPECRLGNMHPDVIGRILDHI